MSFAPLYLLNRLFFRVSDFFHHWYLDGSRAILHAFVSTFENFDQTLALRVTLRYFWKPLYGDYSIVGRIFGIIFRSGRVIIASGVYFLLGIIMLAVYFIWLSIPFAILLLAYRAYITKAHGI